MSTDLTRLPPQAHALAAQIQDELATFAKADPARHNPMVRRAGERAWRLTGDLVDVLAEFRAGQARALREYDEARRSQQS